MEELVVECPHRPDGCAFTCQRQLLTSHLQDSCPDVRIPCPHDDCEEPVLRKDAKKYGSACTHRLIKCEGCESEVKVVDLEVSLRPEFTTLLPCLTRISDSVSVPQCRVSRETYCLRILQLSISQVGSSGTRRILYGP